MAHQVANSHAGKTMKNTKLKFLLVWPQHIDVESELTVSVCFKHFLAADTLVAISAISLSSVFTWLSGPGARDP